MTEEYTLRVSIRGEFREMTYTRAARETREEMDRVNKNNGLLKIEWQLPNGRKGFTWRRKA